MNNQKSLIIIGAGVAGLSAGIYARLNGFDPLILEMHRIPGGLCTAWKRKGYTFDGAVRYLTSSYAGGQPHQLWQELGIFTEPRFHYYDDFICVEGTEGRQLHFYTNTDRLESHLMELSPQDADLIREFTDGIRSFSRMQLPVDMTASSGVEMAQIGRKMLPVLLPTLKWLNISLPEFAIRFKDPLLREGLPRFFQFIPTDFPMMMCLSTLAAMNDHESGYPLGGSLPIARALEERYLSLGGQMRYKVLVRRILTENDIAVGVELDSGETITADQVVSAADGRQTIYKLLDGRYLDEELDACYQGKMHPSQSIIQVSLGVAKDYSALPPSIDFPLSSPVTIGNIQHDRLTLKHYCFDPSMAAAGKSVLSVWCAAEHAYWQSLAAEKQRYTAQKQEVGQVIVNALDQRLPGLKAALEVIDVATPLTYERYTGNWQGAFAGWGMSHRKMKYMMGKGMPKTLPGLANFYMCGQWVEPGGNVELSCASGRDVIKDIRSDLGLEFKIRA